MKKILEPIVFFGSGPVAAKSLELLADDFEIEAVITKPRPPHHRGEVPVLTLAESLNIPVITATNKTELDEVFTDKSVASRIGVLIDFGIIVSQSVIDYFPLGIVNSHFSVLPQWRGADPITFAILSGQKKTGVSLMLLVEAMDEGPIIDYSEHILTDDITTPKLTDDLIQLSYKLLLDKLPEYIQGILKPQPQSITGTDVSYSRKLTKEDGVIDWAKPAVQIEREIRAFIEWPRSRTKIAGKDIIITKARVAPENSYNLGSTKFGDVVVTPDKQLAIKTAKEILILLRIKPAGKKEMTSEAFLAGYRQLLMFL